MRYTRYNYKKKNNNFLKLLVVLMLFLMVSVLASKGLSGLIKKNIKAPNQENAVETGGTKENGPSEISFWIVQGGYYSKKENAEAANNVLKSKYNSFIVQDGDKFRVVIDIIRKDKGEEFLKTLTEQGVSFVKSKAVISYKDTTLEQIGTSLDALMQHYEKLKEAKVAGIKTEEIKKWSSELKVAEGNAENGQDLQRINAYIEALPEEVTKASLNDLSSFIYSVLTKFKI